MKTRPYPKSDSCKNNAAFGRWAGLAGGLLFRAGPGARLMLAATLAGLAAALAPLLAVAAPITWGPATTIAGDTDVATNGTPFYAYYLGSGNQTVNSVTFTGSSGYKAWGNVSFASGFTGAANVFAAGANATIPLTTTYSNVLNGGAYGGATAGTVTLNGLTVGEAYAVQIWVNDSRSSGAGRSEIASDTPASTVSLTYNIYNAPGGIGQYAVGTFVADNTHQSFTLTPSASGSVQLNAISLRDLGSSTKVWLGGGDTSWGTSANWSPGGTPINGDSILFNSSSTANLATMPDQNYTLATLTLSNAPSAVSIGSSGYTLTINNGINLDSGSQSLTMNDPVLLGGFQTWTNNGNLTVTAGVSGSAGLNIAGTGVTTFTQPATYLYETTISGGTLALSGSASLTSTNITVAGGAAFDVSAQSPNFVLNGRTLAESSAGAVLNGILDCTFGTLSLNCDGVNPSFIQTNGTLTISSATVINVNIPGSLLPAGTYPLIAAATAGNVGQVAVADSLPSVVLTGNGAVGAASLATNVSGGLDLVIAAPDVWTGGSDGNWSTAGNWMPANEPNPADSILFNHLSTANLTISQNDTAAGGVIYGLSLIDPTGSVTIGGPGGLAVYGGGLNLSAASQDLTIGAPLVINANQSWLVTNSRTLTISGPMSSVSGGNVTVSGGGTLKMGAAHVLDNLTNNPATCDIAVNGSTLDLNGNSQVMNGLNVNASGLVDSTGAGAVTLTVGGNNDNSTISGPIQNSGGGSLGLQVLGGYVQLLSTNNTYSGGTVFNGGTLWFPNSSVLSTGPVTFNPGSAAYTFSVTFTNALTLNGGYLHLGGGGYPNLVNQIWSGPVTVVNGFSLSGDNQGCTLTLSGPMNFGTGGLVVTNFGNNGPQEGYVVSLTGDTLSGNISGSGGVNYWLSGPNSRLTVQGANTYTGGTIVTGDPANPGGKLNVWGGINPFSTGPVTLNANAIIEAAPGNATITNALTLNGGTLQSEPQYNNYNTLNWAGPVTLTADSFLVQNAKGTLNSDQSAGVNVSGPLNMNGFTLTCSSPVAAYAGNVISGPISGTGNILQNGINPQALTVSGSNTFSGTFRAVSGTLNVQNAYALQDATLDMNAADAGTVNFNNFNAVIGALTGINNLNLGISTVSIGNNNASTAYDGVLSGGGSLVKIGTGTLTLTGANTFTGAATVSAGTLALTGSGSLASSSIIIGGGATLDASGETSPYVLAAGQMLGNSGSSLATLNGSVDASSGGLSIGYAGGSPLLQVTSGTLTLSGSTTIQVNNTGAILNSGSYTILQAAGGTITGTLPAVAVTGNGAAAPVSLQLSGGNLVLVVSTGTPLAWTGSSSTSWSTAGNWTSGTVPTNGSVVSFNGSSTANLATVLDADFNISGLNVINPTGPVSINGTNTLTVLNNISLGGASQDLTINTPLVLGANQSWSVANGQKLNVNSAVSGAASLTTSGAGTVSLTGINTYTGGTTLAGGTLQIGGSGTLGSGTYAGPISLASGATLEYSSSAKQTLSGVISGNGALAKDTGAGGLTLPSANSYDGGTTISSGSVAAGNAAAFGTGSVTINAPAGLYNVATLAFANSLTLNGGYLRIGGGSSHKLTWSGPVTLTANGCSLGGDGSTAGVIISGNVDIGSSGSSVTGFGSIGSTISGGISGSGVLNTTNTSAQNLTFSGPVSGALSIAHGGGNLALTGANTYTGGTVVNAGAILPQNASALGSGAVTVNGGTLYPTAGSYAIDNPITLEGGILRVGGSSSHLITWSGLVTVNGSAVVTSDGGTAGQILSGGVFMGSAGTLQAGAGSANVTISGAISGAGASGTVESVTNTVYLTAVNTFGGTNRAVGGTLSIGNALALQNATLDMDAADAGAVSFGQNSIIGALTGVRNLNNSGQILNIGNNNASTTYGGGLGGSGGLIKIGTGTLTLAGTNTYTGNTTISAGTLALSGGGLLASTNITVASGATLDVSAETTAFALGAGSTLANSSLGAVINGANNLTSGTLSLVTDGVNPSMIQTNGMMTLSAATVIAVNNTGAILPVGSHTTIIAAATAGNPGSVTGTLPSVTVTGNGAAGNVSLAFNGTGGVDLVVTSATLPPAVINSVVVSGGKIILQGTNGATSGTYSILMSTNLALPLSSWTTNTTGTFSAGGAFSNAIPVGTDPHEFYLIKQP